MPRAGSSSSSTAASCSSAEPPGCSPYDEPLHIDGRRRPPARRAPDDTAIEAPLLRLQRSAGNRAVGGLVAQRHKAAGTDVHRHTRAELFDPAFGTFTSTGPMTEPRAGHAAALLADGRVLIAGGATTDPDARSRAHGTASAEIFDPATGRFTRTADMSLSREGASAFTLPDGGVLIIGGSDQQSAEVYR